MPGHWIVRHLFLVPARSTQVEVEFEGRKEKWMSGELTRMLGHSAMRRS